MDEHYDFIIVGAGSAGCVLADKLSVSGKYQILVLEAGPPDNKFWIKVPLGYGFTYNDPSVNWLYTTSADPGLNNREIYWPRGRVVGGSSSINAMAYARGLPHDFDDWHRAGAAGWHWDNVRKTYEEIETRIDFSEVGEKQVRGSGPVFVSTPRDRMHPFSRKFLEAACDIGWPVSNDFNDAQSNGLSLLPSTMKDGKRWSAADAFLRPALRRSNVCLVTDALVEKIVFDGQRAVGIDYRLGDKKHRVKADGEVILSAGAVNSPQLLQLSGVGSARLLRAHGIDVVHPLSEVGRGLQDHLSVVHYYRANLPTLNNELFHPLCQFWAGLRYLFSRRGPLSVPINQCSGYIRSEEHLAAPDVQMFCNPASYVIPNHGEPNLDKEPGYLLCASPCRPTSRGEISIVSNDPASPPQIQPNSLSTEEDQRLAVKASKLIQKLVTSPSLKAVTSKSLDPDIVPMNDEELLENFRTRASTNYHPTCTCRMGKDESNSVLNERLQVHGLQGVRVIDASSFPNITSGNTNAPTLMLAARGADMMLEDARQSGGR